MTKYKLALWLSLSVIFSGSTAFCDDSQDVIEEDEITAFDREHWSFQSLVRPAVPNVADNSWPRTNIDRFILASIEAASDEPKAGGFGPADRASRRTLIRRLYLDLLGLPPTLDEIDRFISDRRPSAYTRLVDQVLSSPAYGNRWGQHWLDLARFAETDGFEHDNVRPTAWKYRDWVVRALNADLPYDRFVRWQLAGDLFDPSNPDAVVATAFCTSGPDMPDINSQDERRHVLLNEITSTVGEVFLSLQIGCAQCHDHKYDAISQADFYRLRAYFDSAVTLQKNKSVTTLSQSKKPSASRLMIRGDWRRAGPELTAAPPRVVAATIGRDVQDDTIASTTRKSLADWLTDKRHPITARSIVNRVWQFHFGKGLVASSSDFGVMGDEPTHPELLDYLASELMDNNWSLKHLHRQIVRSAVYQTRSTIPTDKEAAKAWQRAQFTDPGNKLLCHFPRQRLAAEVIRDSLLAVSGLLNEEVDGPGVAPPLPIEMVKTLKNKQWKTSPREADHYRKSIYLFARRNLRYPFFATFDRPTADRPCANRVMSTTAVQSLYLMNAPLTMKASSRLASMIGPDNGPHAQVEALFTRAFARKPSESELTTCVGFLNQSSTTLVDLCRAIFNSNEFLYLE